MAETVLAALRQPACDKRGQRSGSGPRKRRNRGDVEHIHFSCLLIAGSIGLCGHRGSSWSSRFPGLGFAGQKAGALFEYRSASVAEIGHVLSQAVFDSRGVGNVANAEAEGVGSARRPLLGGTAILLRRGGCRAEQHCQRLDRKSDFRNHVGYSSDWISAQEGWISATCRAHKKLTGSLEL